MTKVVNKLEEAEVGDLVWMYDENANRYDENRKYLGRGDWKTVTITAKTRLSLECYQTKFMMNGSPRSKNGFAPRVSIYGQEEKENKEWLDRNRYALTVAVQGTDDIEILKKVAELIGYKEK